MSQWRQDPLSGRWVIISARRGARPDEFAAAAGPPPDPAACPFCPGREDRTTPEVAAVGRPDGAAPDTPGWRLRAFPNMYPALASDASAPTDPPWPARAGRGRHEVVVLTPEHDRGLHRFDAADLAEALVLVRDRVRVLAGAPDVRHVLPFVNQGAAAGATLAHPHGQILAAPLVPQLVAEKLARFAAAAAAAEGCLLCDLLAREEQDGVRLVAATAGAVAVAPWASRFPYEVLAAPRAHRPDLADAGDDELAAVATVLAAALHGLARQVPEPALNLVLHGAPTADAQVPGRASFHWHAELLPRQVRLAGFEAGTGFAINPLPPEEAARRLRGRES